MANAPKTFLLVHGAWHGGWCWRRVADLLSARGHKVFTPTLAGLGASSHLLNDSIDLDTHVADIVNFIRWEGVADVVLCGHSYAGMVISGVAERSLPALSSIVFLDAFVPEDGEAILDLSAAAAREAIMAVLRQGGKTVPPRTAATFNVNEGDRAWVDSLTVPQPIGTFTQRIRLTGARERVPRKAYIRARDYTNPAFDRAYARLKSDPSWRVFEVPCGHDVMVDMPELLAEILQTASQ
ncbi:MAG: alpha/beta hydrolase [Betaproteobacteria bacterium]|nr:alpha/beta hydrolase [Betaproteobacteria bacterium]